MAKSMFRFLARVRLDSCGQSTGAPPGEQALTTSDQQNCKVDWVLGAESAKPQ
jgi:hypothetical protein